MNEELMARFQDELKTSKATPSLLGIHLRRLRQLRGWNQSQLADASGVDKSVISRLENGLQRTAHHRNLEALARALEVPAELLKEAGSRPTAPLPVELSRFMQEVGEGRQEAPRPRPDPSSQILDMLQVLREMVSDVAQEHRSRQAAILLFNLVSNKIRSREIEEDEFRKPIEEVLQQPDISPALRQTLVGILQEWDRQRGQHQHSAAAEAADATRR